MDAAYDNGGVAGDSGVQDAYSSPSSSIGRSPVRPDVLGGFEESSPMSPGPVFLHNADNGKSDVQDSKSDTEHNDSGDSKRYAVASVEFARVETPFIIGVWIFCASLAKIGE
jgi:sodium/hydrogen exchanger-like protein 3